MLNCEARNFGALCNYCIKRRESSHFVIQRNLMLAGDLNVRILKGN